MNKITFNTFLTEKRIQAGFSSQHELSRVSGVDNSTIARLEQGKSKPSLDTLKKLAPHINVSYEKMLEAAGYINKQEPSNLPSDKTKKIWDVIARAEELPEENIDQVVDALEALMKHHQEKIRNKK